MSSLKKIVAVLIVSFTVLFLTGKIADKGYRRFWRIFYDKTDFVFKGGGSSYDVLFLGNSTVHFGIDPYYVDSITKLNTYNLGYSGGNMRVMTMFFYSYLQNHPKPKIVVLSVEHSSFSTKDFTNFDIYFDYLQNKYADDYLKDKGYKTGLVKVFPFLKYMYFDDYNRGNMINGFYDSPFKSNTIVYKGFLNDKTEGVTGVKMDVPDKSDYYPLDKNSVTLFHELLTYCTQHQIKILFVFPPRFYPVLSDRFAGTYDTDTMLHNAAAYYQIPYRRFDEPGSFQANEFTDLVHLTVNGSRHYSVLMGDYIDSCLKAKQ